MAIRLSRLRGTLRSFSFWLALTGFAILLASQLVGQFGLVRGIGDEVRRDARDLLYAQRQEIRTALAQGQEDYALNLITAALSADRDTRFLIRLEDAQGKMLEGNLPFVPELHHARSGIDRFSLPEDGPDEQEDSEFMVQHQGDYLALSSEEGGHYRLLIGYRMAHLEALEQSITRRAAGQLALAFLLAVFGSLAITGVILRRLRHLNAACQALVGGDLKARVRTRASGDEFDRLSENFNAMLERIEGLVTAIRQSSDYLAHDLRTPLTHLRNNLAPLTESPEPEAARRARKALAQIDALGATLDAILLLGRAEAGTLGMEAEPVDVGPLLEDVAELYGPLAEAKQQTLQLELDAPGSVAGRRQLLAQAVTNLIDNAIKYTSEGGHILLRAAAVGGRLEITVEDDGPGIPPDSRVRAVERFVRLDPSRTTPGTGLGLSLVAAIARLHGGELRLEGAEPHGLRAVISLESLA